MPTPPGISPCSIKVIGVGGGGGNTINRMASVAGAGGFLEFVAVNTDVQALAASQADVRVQIGDDGARGLGAGGIPAVGRASAIAAEDDLYPIVAGVDMVFVTAGMGGGTGSGAAPVVACWRRGRRARAPRTGAAQPPPCLRHAPRVASGKRLAEAQRRLRGRSTALPPWRPGARRPGARPPRARPPASAPPSARGPARPPSPASTGETPH